MIEEERVLLSEFVPNDVRHRDHEINHLSSALRPITNGRTAQNVFLYGTSGTGKTCIAQYTVKQLETTVPEVNWIYINCWEEYSRFKILYRVLDGLNQATDIHRQSTATDTLLERLHDYDGPPYVVILDEADQLQEMKVLYDLNRVPNISLILIANDDDEFFSRLNSRLTSRLQSSARIRFESYTDEQLNSILWDRAEWGLHTGAITNDQLSLIAGTAGGDARVAIGILRSAAVRAEEQGTGTITDDVIATVTPEAKEQIRQKNINKLTEDQQALYNIISERKEIDAGKLYERYRDQVERPKTQRMVRNYLSKMCHYNLIETRGEKRGRSYRAL